MTTLGDKPQHVLEIVESHLKTNGYDGLYFPGECACLIGDLEPCGQINSECVPGYVERYPDNKCDGDCAAGGGCDFHVVGGRPAARRDGTG